MQKTGYFIKSVSALIVAAIVVTAFTKEPLKIWLLIAALAVWALCLILKASKGGRAGKKRARKPKKDFDVYEPVLDASTTEQLLLRHVNYRISAYLKSVYPGAAWEWESEHPEQIAADGGTGRIRLHGAGEFTHADVTLDRNARITCDLLRIKRIDGGTSAVADPSVWFELHGRAALAQISDELESRGYTELSIRDNGDVCTPQTDGEVKISTLAGLPDKLYWSRLAEIFEESGYVVFVDENSFTLSLTGERCAE